VELKTTLEHRLSVTKENKIIICFTIFVSRRHKGKLTFNNLYDYFSYLIKGNGIDSTRQINLLLLSDNSSNKPRLTVNCVN
jgi:hypothetical protein